MCLDWLRSAPSALSGTNTNASAHTASVGFVRSGGTKGVNWVRSARMPLPRSSRSPGCVKEKVQNIKELRVNYRIGTERRSARIPKQGPPPRGQFALSRIPSWEQD
jgi:hypothetical protein